MQIEISAREQATHRRTWKHDVPAYLLLSVMMLSYSALLALYLAPRNAMQNLDFWYWTGLATQLNGADLNSLVNGLYPLGYPLLLRLAIDRGIDSLRFAYVLSWLGGLLCLLSAFGIVYHTTRRMTLTLFCAALLAVNFNFLSHAGSEGTDMLAAGLQMLALYALWLLPPRAFARTSVALLLAAGLALGLAYLVRYTTLVILPCAVVYLLWKTAKRHEALTSAALLIAVFFLSAAVQIVPSTIVHQQPFYNWQAKNVWFGLYGQGDWLGNWLKMRDDVSLLEVIAIDPHHFFEHWWTQFASAFHSPMLWTPSLHLAWLVGVIALVSERRLHRANRLLLVLALLLPIVVTAMAWLSPRFLLVTLALQAVVIALLIDQISSVGPWPKAMQSIALTGLLLAVAVAGEREALTKWLNSPVRTSPQTVNDFLRLAGMRDPQDVATNDPWMHATDIPSRARYAQTYTAAVGPSTLAELLDHPVAASWRYLVLNYKDGFGDYRAIREATLKAKSQLAPLLLDKSTNIFCISPCPFDDTLADAVMFDNGMRLMGHRWQEWRGQLSLYLYWQTDKALDRSYKVSARILDNSGQILFQVDNVPQVWTYPTHSWRPGETVVDFYNLTSDVAHPSDYRLALVVYDEQTLKPVAALTRDGNPLGEVVVLPRYTQGTNHRD